MSRLSPKDRQASILASATRMAHLHGYQRITRADVAMAAECSQALVSSYFGTMIQLRRAVVRAAIKNRDVVIVAQALAADDAHIKKAPEELRRAAAASLVK